MRRAWEVLRDARRDLRSVGHARALAERGVRAGEARRWRAHIDDVEHVWTTTYHDRQVGSMESYFRGLGLDDDAVAECLRIRTDFTRDALVPRDGAIETLDELQRRGFKRGVISVCSSDVEELWDETELAPHVDDVVLSCAVGLSKPDPRIYELACERLDVAAGRVPVRRRRRERRARGRASASACTRSACCRPAATSRSGPRRAAGSRRSARSAEVLALVDVGKRSRIHVGRRTPRVASCARSRPCAGSSARAPRSRSTRCASRSSSLIRRKSHADGDLAPRERERRVVSAPRRRARATLRSSSRRCRASSSSIARSRRMYASPWSCPAR